MIRFRKLSNGVRVLTDREESVRSCAIGLWVEVGSQLEQGVESGLTHFIEHMLFKGTPRYSAIALADELNRLGGHVNAHTSQEVICLHARCVDDKAPAVLDLLSEMLLESTFLDEEIKRERNVILEEYKMYEDSPDDLVVDLFFQTLWPRSPLGRPVIGKPETIRRFSSRAISKYWDREFTPPRVMIVLAGNFDARKCRSVIDRRFSKLRHGNGKRIRAKALPARGTHQKIISRETEQVHFCFGGGGPTRTSADRYAFGLLNMILGGGMSSRLFKEVREKRGLVYSIQSFTQAFSGGGSYGIAGSTSPDALDEVLRITCDQLEDIRDRMIDEDELDIAREQVIDSILMGVESTTSRMVRLAETTLSEGKPASAEEIIDRFMKVDRRALKRAARKYLSTPLRGAFIGPENMKTGALRKYGCK